MLNLRSTCGWPCHENNSVAGDLEHPNRANCIVAAVSRFIIPEKPAGDWPSLSPFQWRSETTEQSRNCPDAEGVRQVQCVRRSAPLFHFARTIAAMAHHFFVFLKGN